MNLDFYRLLEVGGIWMAAIATFFAAVVALHVAKRQDDIRLKASATSGWQFSAGGKEEIVVIRVINIARRSATISSVGWKFSRFNNFELYQTLQPPNPVPPITVSDGQLVSINLPVFSNAGNWYDQFSNIFLKFNRLRRFYEIRALRLQIVCTTGEEFLASPSSAFLNNLRTAILRAEKVETS